MHTHATPRTPAPKAKPAQPRHNHFRVLARPSLLERIESRTGIDAPGLFIIAMSLVTLVAMGLLIHLFRD